MLRALALCASGAKFEIGIKSGRHVVDILPIQDQNPFKLFFFSTQGNTS